MSQVPNTRLVFGMFVAIYFQTILAPPAHASSTEKYDKIYKRCMGNPAKFHGTMASCALKTNIAIDADITALIKKIRAALQKNDRQRMQKTFEDSQTAWLAYRDNQCTLDLEFSGTSMAWGTQVCALDKNKVRVKELEMVLSWFQ